MKILFLGSPEFAKIALSYLLNSHHKVVAVVCQMDKPSGRGNKLTAPAVKPYALENNIPVLQFDKVSRHLDEINKLDFDISASASFGQILSRDFLAIKPCLNLHPSLLPKYRGATPIQTALLNNDKKTGITVQKMRYEVDSGEIYLQKEFPIEDDDDFESLSTKLAHEGGKMLVEVLDKLEKKEIEAFEQQGEIVMTKLIEKQDGFLDFKNSSASHIVGQVRAYGCNPGAYFFMDGERYKVYKATVCEDLTQENSRAIVKDKRFVIKAKENSVQIEVLQGQNGKKMDIKSFLNGFKQKSMMVE